MAKTIADIYGKDYATANALSGGEELTFLEEVGGFAFQFEYNEYNILRQGLNYLRLNHPEFVMGGPMENLTNPVTKFTHIGKNQTGKGIETDELGNSFIEDRLINPEFLAASKERRNDILDKWTRERMVAAAKEYKINPDELPENDTSRYFLRQLGTITGAVADPISLMSLPMKVPHAMLMGATVSGGVSYMNEDRQQDGGDMGNVLANAAIGAGLYGGLAVFARYLRGPNQHVDEALLDDAWMDAQSIRKILDDGSENVVISSPGMSDAIVKAVNDDLSDFAAQAAKIHVKGDMLDLGAPLSLVPGRKTTFDEALSVTANRFGAGASSPDSMDFFLSMRRQAGRVEIGAGGGTLKLSPMNPDEALQMASASDISITLPKGMGAELKVFEKNGVMGLTQDELAQNIAYKDFITKSQSILKRQKDIDRYREWLEYKASKGSHALQSAWREHGIDAVKKARNEQIPKKSYMSNIFDEIYEGRSAIKKLEEDMAFNSRYAPPSTLVRDWEAATKSRGAKAQLELAKQDLKKMDGFPEPTSYNEYVGKNYDAFRKVGRQAGFADPHMLQFLGGAAVGGVIGGQDGDVMGAIIGAIAGGTLTLAAAHAMGLKSAGTATKQGPTHFQHLATGFSRGFNGTVTSPIYGAWIGRGIKTLNRFGPTGQVLAQKLKNVHETYTQKASQSLGRIDEAIAKSKWEKGDKRVLEVRDAMLKRIAPGRISKEAQRVYASIQKELDTMLDEELASGLIDISVYQTAKLDRGKAGFLPVVIDDAVTSTPKGKENWVRQLSEKRHRRESLEATIKGLLGGGEHNRTLSKELLESIVVHADGTASLTPDAARALLANKHANPFSMVHSGVASNPVRDVIGDFTIQDPLQVVQDYITFTRRRIEAAKEFGAKGEKARLLAKQIGEDMGQFGAGAEASKFAEQQYYTYVRSAKSEVVASAANTAALTKRLIGSAKAYETLKLVAAQVATLPQALVHGTVAASKMTGNPIWSFMTSVKAHLRQLDKETRRELLARTGAALETRNMEYIGEASSAIYSIIPEHLLKSSNSLTNKLLTPGQILNNPSKFLRAVRFVQTESYVRAVAADMGEQVAQHLADKYAKEVAKGGGNKLLISQLEEGLMELGISPATIKTGAKDLGAFNGSLDRAGLSFSNKVNFSNVSYNLPPAWQHSGFVELFRQFKTFIYHQTDFVMDNMLKPAVIGARQVAEGTLKGDAQLIAAGGRNLQPLSIGLAVGTPVGMTVDEFKRFISGDDRELTMTQRVLRGLVQVGGAGILSDLVLSYDYNRYGPLSSTEQLMQYAGGPASADVVKIYKDVADGIANDNYLLPAKNVIRNTNVVTKRAYDALFGEPELYNEDPPQAERGLFD